MAINEISFTERMGLLISDILTSHDRPTHIQILRYGIMSLS